MTRNELGNIFIQRSFTLRVHASELKGFLDILIETPCDMRWFTLRKSLQEMRQCDYELYERLEANGDEPCLIFYPDGDGDVCIASVGIAEKIGYPMFDLEDYHDAFFQRTNDPLQTIPENILEGLLLL